MDFLILSPGSSTSLAAGNFTVFGTQGGAENVTLITSEVGALNVVFDPSFNEGGDAIIFTGAPSDFSITRSGSSVIISDGIVTATIPAGLARVSITFAAQDGSGASAEFDLRIDADTQSIVLGDQVIETGDPQPIDGVIAFTSPAAVAVAENQTTALDADIAAGPSATFSLSGDDAALFAIDPQTGVVTFSAAPDFEAPGDSDGDNIYELIITASNETSAVSQAAQVSVSDVDESSAGSPPPPAPPVGNRAPVIDANNGRESVGENQTAAFTIDASDPDGDELTFAISGEDADLFSVDAATGVVTFNAAPDLEDPDDADGDNRYQLRVTASDGGLSDSADIEVRVNDVNEAPGITSDTTLAVQENQTAVVTAEGTDPEGSALTFSISGNDAALFSIDAGTGVITFNQAPDFENPGDLDSDNIYRFILTASDSELTTSREVAVTVTNANDLGPSITSGAAFTVDENQTAAFTATATDPENDPLTFSLSGVDASLFAIDEDTGEVTFNTAPDFEAPGDDGADNVYNITATVSDGQNSADQDIAITVADVNESPTITSGTTFSVEENQTGAFTAVAVDPDLGDDVTYSFGGGADDDRFEINATSGVVTFKEPAPDFENPQDLAGDGATAGDNIYNVTIVATDTGGLTAELNVAVEVTDVDEMIAPVINEVREFSSDGSDSSSNYIEIFGAPGGTLSGFSIVIVDVADFGNPGRIFDVIDLDELTFDENGVGLIATDTLVRFQPSVTLDEDDIVVGSIFAPSLSEILLIEDYAGPTSGDLDENDDFVFDNDVGSVVDNAPIFVTGSNAIYGPNSAESSLGFHFFRSPDGRGQFQQGSLAFSDQDTPGELNSTRPITTAPQASEIAMAPVHAPIMMIASFEAA